MNVGFVGLGAMGGGVAARLLAAGRPLTGWNRTKAKAEPLIEAGMAWADTPREVAAASDVVFSMLTDADAVHAAALGPDGILAGLRPGSVYADMSTILPDQSRGLAAQVADTGATMLDAPVSGSMATLEQGRMSVMVGGDRDAFERIRPLLLDMGDKVTYLGANGSALVLKLAINLSLVVQVTSFCESVALAEKCGVDPELAVEAILKSVIASPVIGYRAPLIVGDDMPDVYADVALQQKDQLLGLGMARAAGAATPFAALGNEFLTATRAAGLEKKDFVAVYEVYRRLGGLE